MSENFSTEKEVGKLNLVYGIDPDSIIITESSQKLELNKLSLNITNPQQKQCQLINTNELTPADDLPSYGGSYSDYKLSWFYIWFPWGEGKGDFATSETGGNITVSPATDNDNWYCVKKSDPNIGTYWVLFPKKDTVLDPQESVAFTISNILSQTEPGLSYMYIENHKIPGYDDDKVTNEIWKYQRVTVDSFDISPNPSALVDGKATVQITWEAKHYTSLTLMPFYKDVTNLLSYSVDLDKTTDITLVVTGKGQNNTAYKTVSANVLPSINSFEVIPNSIYYKNFPHDVNMYWDVATKDDVYIVNDNNHTKESYANSGQISKSIISPGMWSVVPKDDPTQVRSALIQSFKINTNKMGVSAAPTRLAASPVAEFIAMIGDGSNFVSVVDSLTGGNYCNPIQVGDSPVDVQFSPRGDYLITANKGGKSLSVIPVSYNDSTSTYALGTVNTVALDYVPNRIAISADNKNIFVSAKNADTNEGVLIVVTNNGNGNFTVSQTISIGSNPTGITVFSSGVQIFVANTADNTVSVVGYNNVLKKYQLVQNVAVGVTSPTDLALAGQNQSLLLVTSQSSNTLLAYDSHNISTCQKVSIGTSPADLKVFSNGAYAFITCKDSNTAVLVDCYQGLGKCKVLENVSVGSKPSGIAVSKDSYVAFIANSNDKTISILNLENYAMNSFTPPASKGANGVAALSDGSTVVTWSNPYGYELNKIHRDKGIYVYNTQSQTGSAFLTDQDISDFVFHPDASKNKAFALVPEQNQVAVVNTQTFNIEVNFPIPNSASGKIQYPRLLSLSGDGKTLFVAATDDSQNYGVIIYDINVDKGVYTSKANISVASIKGMALFDASQDAKHAFLADVNSKTVYAISLNKTYSLDANKYALKATPVSMKASPNNDYIYILTQAGMNNGFGVIDISGEKLTSYTLPSSYATKVSLQQVCISPDGKRLFITDTDIVGVRVVSTSDLRIVQTLSYANNIVFPYAITVLPDSSSIYLAGYLSGNLGIISQIGTESMGANHIASIEVDYAVTDDTYTGFFVRDFVGETPSGSTAGKSFTDSPDIISDGPNLLPDPAVLTEQTNYDNGLPNYHNQTPLQNNYVYFRAINKTSGTQNSTLYMYYVDTTIVLWPQNWKKLGITRLNNDDNSAKLSATAENEIVSVNPPFQWSPPRQGVHYCLTCWIQNGFDQSEPDLYSIGSVPDMAKFIFEHNNVAWRNTCEIDADQPTIQNSTPITGPEEGGPISYGVQCDVPAGGYIQFTVPGPTPETTIIFPKTQIPMQGYTPMVKVTYPAQPGGYQTTMEFTYYKGDQDLPEGSNIIPLVGTNQNPAKANGFLQMVSMKAPENLIDAHHYESPSEVFEKRVTGVNPSKIFLVGSVKYDLKKGL